MCFEYDGYPDIHEEKRVKTRKPHRCEGCHRSIKIGSFARFCSGLFDHEWYNYYVCEICDRYILAIVAKELKAGCRWHEAWISPSDLSDYIGQWQYWENADIVRPLGLRTLEDCYRYINCLHMTVQGKAMPDDT